MVSMGCMPSSHQPGHPKCSHARRAFGLESRVWCLRRLGPTWALQCSPLKPETPALLLLPLQGDCSWFNSCNLAALRSDVPGFVSAARTA